MSSFKQFKQLKAFLVKVLYRGTYIKVYEKTIKPFKPLKNALAVYEKHIFSSIFLIIKSRPRLNNKSRYIYK